jgi:hypothetical protein
MSEPVVAGRHNMWRPQVLLLRMHQNCHGGREKIGVCRGLGERGCALRLSFRGVRAVSAEVLRNAMHPARSRCIQTPSSTLRPLPCAPDVDARPRYPYLLVPAGHRNRVRVQLCYDQNASSRTRYSYSLVPVPYIMYSEYLANRYIENIEERIYRTRTVDSVLASRGRKLPLAWSQDCEVSVDMIKGVWHKFG